jgi:beta-lactamase superfamily II metal-dependent hydrolase
MKKLAILLIAICLFLSAASCGRYAPPISPGHTITPTSSFATPTPSPTLTAVPTGGELKAHFIDVGQGDSILIDLGETEVLIDGGEKSPGLVDYLKKYVDGALEVMVATHPHSDHIGGLIAVLGAFQVQQIWHNEDKSDSSTYNEFMTAVQAEGADVHVGKRGDKIVAGRLTFLILNPRTLAGTVNNNSIVLSFSYGTVDFLFTGDAEKEAEGAMLVAADMPVPDVEVLKVGHHGSRTASSKDFLAATSPEVAVYMTGVGNRYGHPHQETIAALAQIGAKVYGTEMNGTIDISTDGNTFTVHTER